MHNKLELAQDKFIERIGNMCSKFGLNHFLAQLFTVLYLSEKPLSLDDLTQMLKASKGNVSINIRELERWGAVRKIWIKGSRKDYYQAEQNIKKILSERVKSSIQRRISEVSNMIEEFNSVMSSVNEELTSEDKEIAEGYRDKLNRIAELNNLATSAFNFADKFI